MNNLILNKDIVKKRFEKSIATYNESAVVQKEIAQELIKKIVKHGKSDYKKVLEIGCGTGFLTDELVGKIKSEKFFINDIVEQMQYEIEKMFNKYNLWNWIFAGGDAEKIAFPSELDMVATSSTIQWFQNPENFFINISKLMIEDGMLAFSIFGNQNYTEIKSLLHTSLNYLSVDELTSMLSDMFTIIDVEEKIERVNFATPSDVLKHIKQTGVNGIHDNFWTKKDVIDFNNKYLQNFANADGTVSLTYHPIMIIALKK